MTRKDFQAIAEYLRLYAKPYMPSRNYRELAYRVRAALATTNPRFDGAKFWAACEVEDD